jgi:ABC-type Fe3+ transport system permease subunit
MNETKEEELRLFVGENAYYYLIKWSKMADKGNKISWNWPMAAFGVAWLLFSILLGIFGNHLYLRSVKQKIAKIKREISDPKLQKIKMAKKGGVNYIIFIFILVGIPLISILIRALMGTI